MSKREVVCNRGDTTICADCEWLHPHEREGSADAGWCTEWQYCAATRRVVRCTRVPLDAGKE